MFIADSSKTLQQATPAEKSEHFTPIPVISALCEKFLKVLLSQIRPPGSTFQSSSPTARRRLPHPV
jgi:hypothetical protein